MGAPDSLVRCQTPECAGTLGAYRAGDFYPSAHLIGSRDWSISPQGDVMVVRVRCSLCGAWHEARRVSGRIVIGAAAA